MDYKKFIVFVVVLIAALSIGMTAYYFLRDNETIVIKNVEVYVNVGDTFNIEVERQDPKAQTTISFSIANSDIVEQQSTGEFLAKGAGSTEITLITNKQRIETQKCIVHVGDGSEGNPYFVKDAASLKNVGEQLDKNYKMIADVDLTGEEFSPIPASFTGTFDGNGYKISNLTTTATELMQYAGLFEKIGANGVVKDLTVVNANISGNILVAGVIAAVNNGTIQCTKVEESNLSSTADEAKLGGIAGLNKTTDGLAKLDRVASNAVISSANKANLGGIACENENARIINSYFQGRLSSESAQSISAGIVVKNIAVGEEVSALKKSYAVAEYTSNAGAKYGVVAQNIDGTNSNKVYGLYYDESVAGEGVVTNPVGYVDTFLLGAKTTAQMKEQATYVYYVDDTNVSHPWNFETIWSIQEGQTYPALVMRGNESDVDPDVDGAIITTVMQLKMMNMAGAYKLGADIDLAGEANWASIGTEAAPFQGVLDGNGHKIKNLKSNLFGYLGSNATIRNLTIEGVNINKNGTVGALAVRNYGYVENISVSAKDEMNRLQVTPTGDVSVGAIVGINNGTIMGAQSDINITVNENSETGYVGGIVGTNEGYIYNANSASFISVNTAKAIAGGIVGYNSKYINNSKFKGTLTANTTNEDVYVGGVAGYNVSNATINLSGAKANVTGYNVGGVVGFNNYGTVNKCYVLDGSVLTGNKVGGIVSSLQRGEVNDCYSIANLVGSSNGAKKAGFAVYVQGHTDLISGEGECAEMNHCFSACTFDNNGDNYCESYSDVHVSFAGTGHSKEAGYINSSIYDKDKADNAKKSSTSGTWWWGSSEDVGDRSTSSCQSTGTFTDRGFSSTTWNLSTGSYPTLAGVSYDYFNDED